MLTTIPFSGFYESLYSAEIDSAEISIAEDLHDNDDVFKPYTRVQIANALFSVIDYPKVRNKIAREYTKHIAHLAGGRVGLKFDNLRSPREYNFETDRIFATIPRASVRRMRKEVDHATFATLARDRFMSRSGFISYYSPLPANWGPLDKWDGNQVGALFEAWMATGGIALEDSQIIDELQTNNVFDTAVYLAFSRRDLLAKLKEDDK